MSASIEPQGRGGKKDLNASLNLVPYIDLLTCMVAFLLITAVWTQLAQLNTTPYGKGKDDGVDPPMTKIALVVGQDEINVLVNQDREVLPNKDGEADLNTLLALLKKAKRAHPDKDDVQIASADTVQFDRLANVMDVTIAAGFPGVSLLPSSEAGL
jgi:biopolymer transport protein TolR